VYDDTLLCTSVGEEGGVPDSVKIFSVIFYVGVEVCLSHSRDVYVEGVLRISC
jgi:hypothetical protein